MLSRCVRLMSWVCTVPQTVFDRRKIVNYWPMADNSMVLVSSYLGQGTRKLADRSTGFVTLQSVAKR